MIIHGKERKFLLTVQASIDVAEMCPDGDLSRIGEVLSVDSKLPKSMRMIAKMIAAMSRGFESNRKYEEAGYEPDPLTVDEIMALPMQTLKELQDEALQAFKSSVEPKIELKESKKKDGAGGN